MDSEFSRFSIAPQPFISDNLMNRKRMIYIGTIALFALAGVFAWNMMARAAYPNLRIFATHSREEYSVGCEAIRNHDRYRQFDTSRTSYLNITKLLLRLGPNARRLSVVQSPS